MQSGPTVHRVQNLIIGAGPAGLAVAGRLRHAGVDFLILEKASRIADRWYGHYDRVCLHTVKQWSHLPHMPFPDGYPRYVPRDLLIAYYRQYAEQFDLRPIFNTEVRAIGREESGTWKVDTATGTFIAPNVIIASGTNRVPNIPVWPGVTTYQGSILHSIAYRNPEPYHGKTVLVVGMGNTGAEIALDLANAGIRTTISVRKPVNIVPRDLHGRPVQETSKLLARLPFGIGDWIGAKVQKLYFGDLSTYGLPQSKMYPAVELKTTGKTPVIDIGTVKAIKQGKIRVTGEIDHFTEDGIVLRDGNGMSVDSIILATGYKPQLHDFIAGIELFLDPHGYPKSPLGTGAFSGLCFVGFDNYQLGGILGTIYRDSEIIVEHLRKSSAA